MARTATRYVCGACGGVQARWMGKCPDCGTWDTLDPFSEPKASGGAAGSDEISSWWVADDGNATPAAARATPLAEVKPLAVDRLVTGVGEFDRVLGGGLVPGSLALLGGEPGIGKSTLLLQVALRLAATGTRTLYVTSEESAQQIKRRAERLTDAGALATDMLVLAETSLPRIFEQARRVRPAALVIDSIQMVHVPEVEASAGSVAQVRRCCMDLATLARVSQVAVTIVGHVTKDGQLAGPKLLEHLVDVVLSFEGDRHHDHRVVRGAKNRYGTTQEVGLFAMTGKGLAELADGVALADPDERLRPGTVVCPAMHGTRCLLAEIQALTATSYPGAARRRATGLDTNRLAMLIAVLEKHGGLRLADQDVFVSTVGGVRLIEPGVDLALCLAIGGARAGRALPTGTAAIGEVGLGGEIRPVAHLEKRVRETIRRGYRRILVPAAQGASGAGTTGGIGGVVEVADLAAALELLEERP